MWAPDPQGLKARLNLPSVQRQCCNNASDTSFIEYNGVALEWVATPFLSDSITFHQRNVANIIAALTLY